MTVPPALVDRLRAVRGRLEAHDRARAELLAQRDQLIRERSETGGSPHCSAGVNRSRLRALLAARSRCRRPIREALSATSANRHVVTAAATTDFFSTGSQRNHTGGARSPTAAAALALIATDQWAG